ncbi:unnamed protein product [Tilletia controversa]|nr:unnamed protein product [Tilletia controversa]CAD6905252.1 unnamed protein product [Tilletia controversa]
MEGILRKQLKDFQRAFLAQHGRAPSKSDMAKEPGIQSAYDAWHAIRKVSSSSSSSSTTQQQQQQQQQREEGSTSASSTAVDSSQRSTETETAPSRAHKGKHRAPPDTVFTTPSRTKARHPAPTTATPNSTGRKKTNPFATTPSAASPSLTATPSRSNTRARPPTPATIVRIFATPPHPAAAASAGLQDDAHFDYANSPSRLKALIAARSGSAKPGGGSNLLLGKQTAFTPRTKARKRLRGEYVPPTPETKTRTRTSLALPPSEPEEEEEDESGDEQEDEDEDAPEGMGGRPLKRRRDLPNTQQQQQQQLRQPTTSSFKRAITAPALLSSRPGASQASARARGAFLAEWELDYPMPAPPSSESASTGAGAKEYPGLGMGSLHGPGPSGLNGEGSSRDEVFQPRTFRRSSSRAASIFAKGTTSEAESSSQGKGKGKGKGPAEEGDVQMVDATTTTTTTTRDGDDGVGEGDVHAKPHRTTGPRWTLSHIEISDDESEKSDAGGPSSRKPSSSTAQKWLTSKSKSANKSTAQPPPSTSSSSPGKQKITLAPYLRHGTVRSRLLEQDERRRRASPTKRRQGQGEDGMEVDDGPKEEEGEDEDEDDLLEYAFPLLRPSTFVPDPTPQPRASSPSPPAPGPASGSGEGPANNKADTEQDSTRDLTAVQNQHATQARRLRSRAVLRALLGEMEELDLEREQGQPSTSSTGAEPGSSPAVEVKAKTWGQAKEMNHLAAGGKRGKGKGKGKRSRLGLDLDEEDDMEREKERERVESLKKKKKEKREREEGKLGSKFARVGRAGVGAAEEVGELADDEDEDEGEEDAIRDDDEDGDDESAGSDGEGGSLLRRRRRLRGRTALRKKGGGGRADGGDEDWDSEVGSEEYGLGDGEMDEMDVI